MQDDLSPSPAVPLVLLPVRVETRYSTDGTQLRVRIYPDAVHVESLDEGITADERTAGMAYWTAIWATLDLSQAWPALIGAVGQQRAAWVAHALTPPNLVDRPGKPPQFRDTPAGPRQPAMVRTLPDRFHVIVEQAGGAPVEAIGQPIPSEVAVSLPPDSFVPVVGDDELPVVDAATRWTVDYSAALAIGMAVNVPLARPGAPITRLQVIGVRTSLDPAAGAAALERLMTAHCFADGAEFIVQGTPSNNTETDRTAWTRRPPPIPPPANADAPATGSNAAIMASALGINPSVLAPLSNANDMQQPRAEAMATVLWESTWGELLERVLEPYAMTDATRAALREHAIQWVRGRGPLPALRLGREPYGVLPVMPIDSGAFVGIPDTIEPGLAAFLEKIRPLWTTGAESVPTLMSGDLDTVLPEILGTSPVLSRLLVRKVTARTVDMQPATAILGTDYNEAAQDQVNALTRLLMQVQPSQVGSNGTLGMATNRLDLPLTNADDIPFIKALIAQQAVPSPTSVLQVLLAHAAEFEQFHRTLIVNSPADFDRLSAALDQIPSADTRSVAQAALHAVQSNTPQAREVQVAASAFTQAGWRVNRGDLATRQPWPGLSTGSLVQQLTLNGQANGALLRNEAGLQALGEVFAAAQRQVEFAQALQTLASIDDDQERRLLLCETLDLASHRLDAWITSLASRRLFGQRAVQSGAVLGAYAWVENITPDPPVPVAAEGFARPVFESPHDGGFIHAPGLNHATTAAVLRSGRLSHQPSDANSGALNIDLSSARVRLALELIEGMRNGQQLGALLGYRLERWLHERSGNGLELDRFVYVLRALAPLLAGKQTDVGVPQEVVSASAVVDGVHLLELQRSNPAAIDQALTSGPTQLGSADGRYVVVWSPPSADELAAVHTAIAEMDSLHDATADLLLAEGVHQLVQGNTTRAAAALDALAAGEAVPPVPDVVRTPVSGVAMTHRLVVALPLPLPAPVDGWDASQPRAQGEPAIEAWAEHQLGPPEPAMIAAHLCALDLVYDADGDRFDQTSLALRLSQPPDPHVWELARSLRALLVKARPLDGVLLGRTEAAGDLATRAQAAQTALTTAAARVAGSHDLDATLAALLPFGVRIGPSVDGLAPVDRASLADILVAEAHRRTSSAATLIAAGRAADALGSIFGDGFLAVARVEPQNDAFAAACGPAGVTAQDGRDIRPWLARMASIRPAVHRYAEATLFREALGTRCHLSVIQLPVGAPARWVGLPFTADENFPAEPVTAMVVETGFGTPLSGGEELAGFVVDEWIDVAPRSIVTSGMAINAAGPAARPPQAILVAVSPDGQEWTRDKLLHVLSDTLDLARIRGVTLERLPWAGRILPALYFRDWSLQGEPIIRWERIAQRAVSRMAL